MEHNFYLKEFKCPKCGTAVLFKDLCFSLVGMRLIPFCPNSKCDVEFGEAIELVYSVLAIEAQDFDVACFVQGNQKSERSHDQPLKQIAALPPEMTEEDRAMFKEAGIDPGDGKFD